MQTRPHHSTPAPARRALTLCAAAALVAACSRPAEHAASATPETILVADFRASGVPAEDALARALRARGLPAAAGSPDTVKGPALLAQGRIDAPRRGAASAEIRLFSIAGAAAPSYLDTLALDAPAAEALDAAADRIAGFARLRGWFPPKR